VVLFVHAIQLVLRAPSWIASWVRIRRPTVSVTDQTNRGGNDDIASQSAAADDALLPLVFHVILPVLVFSANPHQEPRFLLPLGTLLAALGERASMTGSVLSERPCHH
jgi:hypothetical protein